MFLPVKVPKKKKIPRWLRIVLGCMAAAAVCICAALGYFFLYGSDKFVQKEIKAYSDKIPGSISYKNIRINLGGVSVNGLVLSDAQGAPIVSVGSAGLEITPARVLSERALPAALGNFHADDIEIHAEIDEDGRFNFADLSTPDKEDKEPADIDGICRYLGQYTGTLSLNRARIYFADKRDAGFRYCLDDVKAELALKSGEKARLTLSASPRQEETGSLALYASADFSRPLADVSFVADNLQLPVIAEHPFIHKYVSVHEGRADIDIWAHAAPDKWENIVSALGYGGSVQVSGGKIMLPQYSSEPIGKINADITLATGAAFLREASANLCGMGLEASGRVDFSPRQNLSVLAVVPRLRPEPVAKFIGKDIPVKGSARVEVKAEGSFASPAVRGYCHADKLTCQGTDVTNANLKLGFKEKLITVDEVSADAIGGKVTGSGYVLLGNEPEIVFNVSGGGQSFAAYSSVGGRLDSFGASFVGTPSKPAVFGSVTGVSGFTGAAASVRDVSASFVFSDNEIALSGKAATDSGNVDLPLAVYNLESAEVFGSVRTSGFAIPSVPVANLGNLSGNVRGRLDIFGSAKDLSSLVACGESYGTDISLGNLSISDLCGGIGFENMQVYVPGIYGAAAGGSVAAAGWVGLAGTSSSVSMMADGVDIASFMSILPYNIPLEIGGRGNLGANWSTERLGADNWIKLYADSKGGGSVEPFKVAGRGHASANGLAFAAWTDNLALKEMKINPNLNLAAHFTGKAGIWGKANDLKFAHSAVAYNVPLEGISGNTLYTAGGGTIRNGRLNLERAAVAWNYDREQEQAFPDRQGSCYPWFGPTMAKKLEDKSEAASPLPEDAMLAVEGYVDFAPVNYNLSFDAKNVDLDWLSSQKSIPELAMLKSSVNIRQGFADASGRITSDHGRPRLEGADFYSPWLLVGGDDSLQLYSMAGHAHMGPNKPGAMGPIYVDSAVFANKPFSAGIASFAGKPLDSLPEGLVGLSAVIDGTSITANVAGSDWEVDEVLAVTPQKTHDSLRLISSGKWRTSGIRMHADSRDILSTLALDGDFFLEDAYLTLGNQLIPVERVSASISSSGRILSIDDLILDSGSLHIEGTGKRSADGSWEADLWSEEFPLDYLGYWYPLFGFFDGKGRLALHADSGAGFAAADAYFGFEGSDVKWRTRRGKLNIPVMKLGRIYESDKGFRTGKGSGVALGSHDGNISIDIPDDSVKLTISRDVPGGTEDSTFGASGSLSFGIPDGDTAAWLAGPKGPRFGEADVPFRLYADNFYGNTLLAIFGVPPQEERFTFSSELALSGNWYYGHLLTKAAEDLNYELTVSKWEMGRSHNSENVAEYDKAAGGKAPEKDKAGKDKAAADIAVAAEAEKDKANKSSKLSSDNNGKPQKAEDSWTGLCLNKPIKARYFREGTAGRLKVEPFEMVPVGASSSVNPGSMQGEADIVIMRDPLDDRSTETLLNLKASELDLSEIGQFFGNSENIGYIRNLAVDASGPLLSPAFKAVVSMTSGQLGPVHYAAVDGGITGRNDNGKYSFVLDDGKGEASTDINDAVKIYFGKERREDRTLAISGALPYNIVYNELPASDHMVPVWSGVSVSAGDNYGLAARLNDAGLSLIADVVPGIKETAGNMKGEVTVSGNAEDLDMNGRIDITGGMINHDKAGKITDIAVSGRFMEVPDDEAQSLYWLPEDTGVSRFVIDKFTGLLGNSRFNVRGFSEIVGIKPANTEVIVEGEQLPLKWGDLFNGIADVELRLTALPDSFDKNYKFNPELTGTINVLSGDLSFGLSSLSADESEPFDWTKLQTDYKVGVTLGDDVWIHALGSRIRAAGNLAVVPAPETKQPVLDGVVDLSRGVLTVPLYEVSFKVHSGNAIFDKSVLPTLENVVAEANVSDYLVTAYVSGTVPDIKVEYMSNPPLSERDIQKLLAFGNVTNYNPSANSAAMSESASSNIQMGNQGMAMVSRMVASPITSQIGRLLYLTDFSFEMSPSHSYSIKIAKALDKNEKLLFTLTQVMDTQQGKDESLYGIEWRFKPNLLTRICFDADGCFRPWFQGLWEF